MAGDWIPVETTTPKKSEMLKLAQITGLPVYHVLGIMVSFWCWVSDETTDGFVDADVDALSSLFGTEPEFWRAVLQVGWLKEGENNGQLVVPNFDHWLSNGAKTRLRKTRRQSRLRDNSKDKGVKASTRPSTKRHQRREEKSIKKENSTSLSFAQKIYGAYPRKAGKAKAITAIDAAVKTIAERGSGMMKKAAAVWLLQRVETYAASPSGQPPLGKEDFRQYPATWMNGGFYDNPDSGWQFSNGEPAGPAGVAAPAGKYDAL